MLFFIGWLLSPFTWWNDAFINIPISYILANIIFYITHLPFSLLLVGSYLFTNILGLVFMFFGAVPLVSVPNNKTKTVTAAVIAVVVYSALIICVYMKGKLLPIGAYFK